MARSHHNPKTGATYALQCSVWQPACCAVPRFGNHGVQTETVSMDRTCVTTTCLVEYMQARCVRCCFSHTSMHGLRFLLSWV